MAYHQLKKALTEALVLALPNPDKTFEVVADASIKGIGAVLVLDGRLLAYTPRKLSIAERNYTTTEQEFLALVHDLKTLCCYLQGSEYPLVVEPDHCPLSFLPTQQTASRRHAS